MKFSFKNDYSEGCHPNILKALLSYNDDQQAGYGEDQYSLEAKKLIQQKIQSDSDIYFVSGGTQANLIVISSILKPYQCVISASTGHILNNEIQVNTSEDWKPFTSSFLDESFLIGYLTPEEYFYFIGDLRGQNKADVDALLTQHEEFFNGEILKNKKYLRDLSKGNQKKVGIIATLIGNPEVIILDEPFANLDPTTVNRLKKIIKVLAEDPKITVLVSSHDLQHTVEVCDRIVALNKGEVVKDMTTSEETLQELELFFAV